MRLPRPTRSADDQIFDEASAQRLAQLERMQELANLLSRCLTLESVCEVVLSDGLAVFDADAGAVVLRDGDCIEVVGAVGYDDALVSKFARLELSSGAMLAVAVREQRIVITASRAERDLAVPELVGVDTGYAGTVSLPLVVHGDAIGALGLSFRGSMPDGAAATTLLSALAQQCALAVERARLYDVEHQLRSEAEAASTRLSFVADASTLLSSSLDYDVTLQQLTDLIVPRLADGAAILLGDEDAMRVVAVAHIDPEGAKAMRRLADREAARADNFYLQTARSRQPMVAAEVDPQLLARFATDAQQDADMLAVGYRSAMTVPMAVRGRVIGVITMSTGPSGRTYDDADVTLASDLASRAAVAVDNAVTYNREREVAVTLQRSLLPDRLPVLDGVTLDSAYVPGTVGTEVGGDWYDVIALPGERVGLVVGDVMGRGVRAAAVMGQLRAVVRGYALEDHEPARLMSHLDRVVQALEELQLVTCIYAVYDPMTRELSVASAGHLPPLAVLADGTAGFLEIDPGLPLGVGGGEYVETSYVLAGGTTVLLYTDGLVEARDVAIDEGMESLRGAAATLHGGGEVALCVELLRELGRESDHDDDTALLAMRTSPEEEPAARRAAHIQLVQATTSVAQARVFVITTLRAWGLERLTETTVLLTSELVTNAVVHAQSTVHVWVIAEGGSLRIDVVDASSRPIEPQRDPRTTAEGGRGLFLVATMSAEWGSEGTATGKRVWFRLDT